MVSGPIGVLALQGAVDPHIEKLQQLGIPSRRVLVAQDLEQLSGLILPGGESTAMLKLLDKNQLTAAFEDFVTTRPVWGICAGAILLAKKVSHPEQRSFAAIDLDLERNAYGRQIDSFESHLVGSAALGFKAAGIFIRAPRITRYNTDTVRVLLSHADEPVMVESGRVLLSTFHPELTDDPALHQYFASHCR